MISRSCTLISRQVQRAAEAAAADIEWSEEGSIEDEGEGEIV